MMLVANRSAAVSPNRTPATSVAPSGAPRTRTVPLKLSARPTVPITDHLSRPNRAPKAATIGGCVYRRRDAVAAEIRSIDSDIEEVKSTKLRPRAQSLNASVRVGRPWIRRIQTTAQIETIPMTNLETIRRGTSTSLRKASFVRTVQVAKEAAATSVKTIPTRWSASITGPVT
jgi:hypothetical protein